MKALIKDIATKLHLKTDLDVYIHKMYALKKENRLKKEKAIQFYSKYVQKGDLCFDIGANIGDFSQLFLELGARIVAVEPQDTCFRFLQKRFSGLNNITLINKALADKEGEKYLYIADSHTISSMAADWIEKVKESKRFDNNTWSTKTIVPVTTLDNLIKSYGVPKYCKIDVEGFEYEVLQGLSYKIDLISIEFAPESLEKTIQCIRYLEKFGTLSLNFMRGNDMVFDFEAWASSEEIILYIQSNSSMNFFGDIYIKYLS